VPNVYRAPKRLPATPAIHGDPAGQAQGLLDPQPQLGHATIAAADID
jgi:hypothetical protein